MKLVALMTLIALCVALDNGVALTPPMVFVLSSPPCFSLRPLGRGQPK